MYANELATGRNHKTSDFAKIVIGGTYLDPWFRVELTWNNGAFVSEVYDTQLEAEEHLIRLGWFRR